MSALFSFFLFLLLLLGIAVGIGSFFLMTKKGPKADQVKILLKETWTRLKELFSTLKNLYLAIEEFIKEIFPSNSGIPAETIDSTNSNNEQEEGQDLSGISISSSDSTDSLGEDSVKTKRIDKEITPEIVIDSPDNKEGESTEFNPINKEKTADIALDSNENSKDSVNLSSLIAESGGTSFQNESQESPNQTNEDSQSNQNM